MQRILVAFPQEIIKDLEELAKKKKVSRAEIIRLATDRLIQAEKSGITSKLISEAFGLWKNNPMTDEDLRTLRNEWEMK